MNISCPECKKFVSLHEDCFDEVFELECKCGCEFSVLIEPEIIDITKHNKTVERVLEEKRAEEMAKSHEDKYTEKLFHD